VELIRWLFACAGSALAVVAGRCFILAGEMGERRRRARARALWPDPLHGAAAPLIAAGANSDADGDTLGRLAGDLAEEINNPTAVISANLSYLAEHLRCYGVLPEDGPDSLADSLAASDRIARVVQRLLDAGCLEHNDAHALVAVPVRGVIDGAVDAVHRLVPERRVAIVCDVAVNLGVIAEPATLERALVAVLHNAVQAASASPAGRVVVTAAVCGERVAIGVADNGPGVAPAVQRRMFEPFVTTGPPEQGAGLGLHVARRLMRSLHGELSLAETGSRGTRMHLDLPAAQLRAGATAEPFPRRLLVVDDDRFGRRLLENLLRADFIVEGADGVDSALALVRAGPELFDLVLCDVMMPDGGGIRFESELSAIDPRLAAHTIFFTGGAVGDEAERFVETRHERVLAKPLDREAVKSLARDLLEEA